MTAVFQKPEKRTHWETTFNAAKQKLVALNDHHAVPDFIASIPIRKTRAGLQFTCASATLGQQSDVWVCNSDGYVGQVCVLSLIPEPTVTSCNGVCNARILCVASVPACTLTDILSVNSRCTSTSAEEGSSTSVSSSARSSRVSSGGVGGGSGGGVTVEKKPSNVSVKSNTSTESIGMATGSGASAAGSQDIQLDLASSSDDSDETEAGSGEQHRTGTEANDTFYSHHTVHGTTSSCPQLSSSAPQAQLATSPSHQEVTGSDDLDVHQSTMWLGTEDGCIHIYNCTDNIRTKKHKIKIQLNGSLNSML